MDLSRFPAHQAKVDRLQMKLQQFHAAKTQVRIYHGGSNSTRPLNYSADRILDISDLNEVLEINPEERFVLVEPNVTMKALVEATLAHGLIPPVVMELRSITVGGGIQGGAGESSSFKYGPFHDTCLAYEVLTGNGERVVTSPTEESNLFRGLPATYGTIGVITLVKLSLIPAQPFVHLTYERTGNFDAGLTLIKEHLKEDLDFVDAIQWSKESGVVMTGYLSEDDPQLPHSRFLRPWDDWFYLHAEKITRRHASYEELIPIRDYLFRYNRGAFWMGRFGFSLLHLPYNRLTRLLLHPLFKTRMLYRFLQQTQLSQRYLLQDCVLPENTVADFVRFVDRELSVYPLWILPFKQPSEVTRATHGFLGTPLVVDIGLWGEVKLPPAEFVQLNQKIERVLTHYRGCKVLYAHTYYTREDFWKIYNQDQYTALREHYHATSVFPDIYDKVHVRETLRPQIIRGIFRALLPPYRPRVSKSPQA